MDAIYRFRQGLRALASWLQPVDDTLAEAYLSPPLFALFAQMRRVERQHSIRVLQALRQDGYRQPDLLAAALLHDVGKIHTDFYLLEKVLVVLVKALCATLYYRWGSGPARGWRRPFVVSVQHPIWGAEMVAEAGGSPLAVELIRRHADPPPAAPVTDADHLLLALQTADDHN